MRQHGVFAIIAGLVLSLAGTTAAGMADEPDGDQPTYVLAHEGPSLFPVGSAVNVELTATDSDGLPLEGLRVRFVRTGPSDEVEATCPSDSLELCDLTDADGKARYEYAGSQPGTAEVFAEVYTAEGVALALVGPDVVGFGGVCRPLVGAHSSRAAKTTCISAKLSGRSRGGQDILVVNAASKNSGARVRLQRKTPDGWRQVGQVQTLNSQGDQRFSVMDRNANRFTKYRAKVIPTASVRGDTTNMVRLD